VELRRLDDYQSWLVAFRGTGLLIDPWLDERPIAGAFNRHRRPGWTTLADLARDDLALGGVLLCAPFDDHLRADTLRAIADVPVHGNAASARAARRIGSTTTHAHRPGQPFEVACRDGGTLRIAATACGLPLGVLANGWWIEAVDADGRDAGRVWIEPHRPTVAVAVAVAARGPVDVAVLPTHAVVAAVLPITASPRQTSAAAVASGARLLVPTATDPRRDMSTWQKAVYAVRGGDAATAAHLVGPTRLVALQPGDRLPVREGR
jgi:L-ascorbate metabolism protein UlaG (beta-lactamase superfamily)